MTTEEPPERGLSGNCNLSSSFQRSHNWHPPSEILLGLGWGWCKICYIICRPSVKVKCRAPCSKLLRISRWQQQSIKPSVGPFWVQAHDMHSGDCGHSDTADPPWRPQTSARYHETHPPPPPPRRAWSHAAETSGDCRTFRKGPSCVFLLHTLQSCFIPFCF